MKKIIILVLVLAIILGVAFYFLSPRLFKQVAPVKPVTLTVWGLWEDEGFIKPAIDSYQKAHPNITINYRLQTSTNYRTRSQTQITEGQGPDIFMIHNSWLPMYLNNGSLAPAPESVFTLNEYKSSFYPVLSDSFVSNNQIYGVSRGVDGLALYYNEDIMKAAGITQTPQTWDQFVTDAVKMTVVDGSGQIQTAGAALGSTGNVDHWSDIVGLLFSQQPSASLLKPNTQSGAEVLSFYTNLVTNPTQKVWDTTLPSSTQMFASGKLGFYFAPSWKSDVLHQMNPQLQFKTAAVPQLPGRNVTWATFWGYSVSAKSANSTEAWQFLKYLTSADTEKSLYEQASNIRLFGLPYSQVSLQQSLLEDPIVGSFVSQAPYYKMGYLSSDTRDQGINDQIIKYYEDAVNATLQGRPPLESLNVTASGITQVLTTFNTP